MCYDKYVSGFARYTCTQEILQTSSLVNIHKLIILTIRQIEKSIIT